MKLKGNLEDLPKGIAILGQGRNRCLYIRFVRRLVLELSKRCFTQRLLKSVNTNINKVLYKSKGRKYGASGSRLKLDV